MEHFCSIRAELLSIYDVLRHNIDVALFAPHQMFRRLYLIHAERILLVICERMHEFNSTLPNEIESKLMGDYMHFSCMSIQHAIDNTAEQDLFVPGIKALVDVINRFELAHVRNSNQ